MRKIVLFALAMLCLKLFAGLTPGKNNRGNVAFSVIVNGKITNIESGSPVPSHSVFVIVDFIGVSDTVKTDINGFYSDTIPDVPAPGISVFVGTYDCNMVMHSQTILSIPTPVTVNFSICDTTIPVECQADFYSVLDSFSFYPNTYRFFDISTGQPSLWFWNFGDGTGSGQKNPVHTYNQPGTYKVCLTIVANGQGTGNCTDSMCRFVSTPDYFNLGGLVYTGNFPINNPEPQGDTGLAMLYRIQDERLIPVDTCTFSHLGYYAFPFTLPGDYLIRIELTHESNNFDQWFPAYFPSSLGWKDASLISLSSNLYDARIDLIPVSDIPEGDGSISGTVVNGELSFLNQPLAWQEVLLFSSDLSPQDFTYSDIDGKFIFSGLELGEYYLRIESAGKYSSMVPVILKPDQPVISNVILERFDHDITGIREGSRNPQAILNLFPNPAGSEINVTLLKKTTEQINIQISGIYGSVLMTCKSFHQSFTLNIEQLLPGIYLLMIRDHQGFLIGTRKFVKLF